MGTLVRTNKFAKPYFTLNFSSHYHMFSKLLKSHNQNSEDLLYKNQLDQYMFETWVVRAISPKYIPGVIRRYRPVVRAISNHRTISRYRPLVGVIILCDI